MRAYFKSYSIYLALTCVGTGCTQEAGFLPEGCEVAREEAVDIDAENEVGTPQILAAALNGLDGVIQVTARDSSASFADTVLLTFVPDGATVQEYTGNSGWEASVNASCPDAIVQRVSGRLTAEFGAGLVLESTPDDPAVVLSTDDDLANGWLRVSGLVPSASATLPATYQQLLDSQQCGGGVPVNTINATLGRPPFLPDSEFDSDMPSSWSGLSPDNTCRASLGAGSVTGLL